MIYYQNEIQPPPLLAVRGGWIFSKQYPPQAGRRKKVKSTIVGQPAKLWTADGRFVRLGHMKETLPAGHYFTVGSGGGFDEPEATHTFAATGTVVRRIVSGSANTYAVTEIDEPSA